MTDPEGSGASNSSLTFGDPKYIAALLAAALVLTLVARVKSGSWSAPWFGHRPLVWLLIATAVPPLAVILLLVHSLAKRPSAPMPAPPTSAP